MAAPFDAAKPRKQSKSPSMSLEQALFEEEQEVLKLIGAKQDALPPAPLPIGQSRHGSHSKSSMLGPNGDVNNKSLRSSSHVGTRRDLESLLSPQNFQFPTAPGSFSGGFSRPSVDATVRRKSAPDHHRRSSSPVPKPAGLKPSASSPPPTYNLDKAYRRLSNAAMAQAGGSLGRLANRANARSNLGRQEDVRLEKDKDPDSVIESSSSDSESETSRPASRQESPRLTPMRQNADEPQIEGPSDRIPRSLSAAAEQERTYSLI